MQGAGYRQCDGELIDLIYAALLGEASWQGFLDRLSDNAPDGRTILFSHNMSQSDEYLAMTSRCDGPEIESYAAHYVNLNPWLPHCAIRRVGLGVYSDEIVPPEQLRSSEFYNDWLAPNDIACSVGVTIDKHGDCPLIISTVTTREALSRVERVKKPSIRKARQRAAQESVKVRVNKKFLILDQVVDFLEANPKLMQESSGVIADRLNAVGILTNWSRPWTGSSVRGKMREINEELLFRREIREEEAVGEAGTESSSQVLYDQLPEIDCRDAIVPVAADVPVSGIDAEPSGPIAELSEEEREYAELKRLPTFGMF